MIRENFRIGTSGFSYKDWLGNFYPQFCPPADFLRFYSAKFKTVEIDATFYRVPTDKMVERWNDCTPDSFVFAAKFPKMVTHEGDIESRLSTAQHFVKVMGELGGKLGPLLLQFPYGFKPDSWPLLKSLIETLEGGPRIAVELRNKAWLKHPDLLNCLRDNNMALCLIDHPWMPRLDIATADFHYLRFLGDRKKIENDFSYIRFEREEDLQWWRDTIAKIVREDQVMFAFFNNHYTGHSPSTAARMIQLLSE